MTYGSWDIKCKGQSFLPFDHPKNPKNQNSEKNSWIYYMCTINVDHMVYGSWDIKHGRQNFFSFWAIFLPFYPTNNPENQIFQQQKNSLRYYHFTHEWLKSKSCDVWFLRYGAQQTEFFVILGYLFALLPLPPPP